MPVTHKFVERVRDAAEELRAACDELIDILDDPESDREDIADARNEYDSCVTALWKALS